MAAAAVLLMSRAILVVSWGRDRVPARKLPRKSSKMMAKDFIVGNCSWQI
jgi:hypothetical protein